MRKNKSKPQAQKQNGYREIHHPTRNFKKHKQLKTRNLNKHINETKINIATHEASLATNKCMEKTNPAGAKTREFYDRGNFIFYFKNDGSGKRTSTSLAKTNTWK